MHMENRVFSRLFKGNLNLPREIVRKMPLDQMIFYLNNLGSMRVGLMQGSLVYTLTGKLALDYCMQANHCSGCTLNLREFLISKENLREYMERS